MSDRFAKSALREIDQHQARWAELREIELDGETATLRVEDNLLAPLSTAGREAFANEERAQGDDPAKPSDLRRLDSTSALLLNVFDYWMERKASPLASGLGLEDEALQIEYRPALPRHTDSDETICAADVLLEADGARPIALTASLAEPYLATSAERLCTDCNTRGVWGPLQGCRNLALEQLANPTRTRRLGVATLLERSLALSNHFGRHRFQLLHLWYDVPGQASQQMRREVDGFRIRCGGDVDFVSMTWQEFFRDLELRDHQAYGAALAARYFSPGSVPGSDRVRL